jgi:MFS family permease
MVGRGRSRRLYGAARRLAIDVTPLRTSRDFRRAWIASLFSSFGLQFSVVALPIQMYRQTGSTFLVGLLGIAELVPLLIGSMLAGGLADAVDRRHLMLASEAVMAAVAGLLLVNALAAHPSSNLLFLAAFLLTSGYTLGAPAIRSLPPRLVPPDQFVAASALSSLASNANAVIGPALGGVLIGFVSLSFGYVLQVATALVALACVATIAAVPPGEEAETVSLRSLVDSFRFLRTQPVVLGVFLVDTNAMVFGMPEALMPAEAHRLGGGAVLTGVLYAAPSAGATVATLVSGWTGRIVRRGRWVNAMVVVWGVGIIVFGASTTLVLVLAGLAVAGAADLISAVLRSAIVMEATPDHLRARIAGVELAQVASAPSIGNAEAGLVASATSVPFSIISGGVVCIVGVALLMRFFPALDRYRVAAPG